MVERSIIRVKTDQDSPSQDEDINYDFSWFTSHPGDAIESKINLTLKKQQQNKSADYAVFASGSGSIIFIRWYSKLNLAISAVLHIFGDNSAVVPVSTWSSYVLKYHISNPQNEKELEELFEDTKIESDSEERPSTISLEYLQYSLEGKEIVIKENTSKEALQQLISIIETMPWTVFLLDFGLFSGNKLIIKFKGADVENQFSYELLYIILTGGINNHFWNLTYKLLSQLVNTPENTWFSTIRDALYLIQKITVPKQDAKKSFEIIKESMHDILDLDFEYGESFITNCFSDLALKYPEFEISKTLLDLASSISQSKFTDLIKLAEGTALQIAFMLVDAAKREEIFLIVTERSKTWGIDHLVGYIQSVTGILSETEENRKILAKIVQSSEAQLNQSWDGSLCLVETNLVAGEFKKAFELRLKAVDLLTEQFMRAEDIINAVKWAAKLDGLQENDLVALAMPQLDEAFVTIPNGELFISNVNGLFDNVIHFEKTQLLSSIITWFSTNLNRIEINDRLELLQSMSNRFSQNKKYSQLLVQVRLTLFNHYLENPNDFGYEMSEDLLRLIYNNVDPNKSNSKELITNITRWVILASSKFNRPELIDEAKTRYNLLVSDKDFARKQLIIIFARASKNRISLPRSKLRKEGIGTKFLEEILEISNPISDNEILFELLPDAKELLLKKQAYLVYARYALLEIQLNLSSGNEWLEMTIDSTRKLVEVGEIQATNIIFERILSIDLSRDQEMRILSVQLEYVEIEPDLIDADEIFIKRKKLIELQESVEGEGETGVLLEHYRNGISELMSKGDVTHLNEFLLQAIIFCSENKLNEITEFSNILTDSYKTNIEFYYQSKSTEIYNQLVKMCRQINSTFLPRDQTLPVKFSNLLIQTNLTILESFDNVTFLRRAQLIAKEISFVLKDVNPETTKVNEEEKQQLILTVIRILDALIERNPVFGNVDATLLATQFFYSVNQGELLFPYLDQTLSILKKSYINSKSNNSNIIFGLLLLSEVFLLVEGEFESEFTIEIKNRAIRLIDVGLASTLGSDVREDFQDLKSKISKSPEQAFHEFPFVLENFLLTNDIPN